MEYVSPNAAIFGTTVFSGQRRLVRCPHLILEYVLITLRVMSRAPHF